MAAVNNTSEAAALQVHKELFDLMAKVRYIAEDLLKVQDQLAGKLADAAATQGLDVEQVAFEWERSLAAE